jgi:hypothetical protein
MVGDRNQRRLSGLPHATDLPSAPVDGVAARSSSIPEPRQVGASFKGIRVLVCAFFVTLQNYCEIAVVEHHFCCLCAGLLNGGYLHEVASR